MFSFITYTFGFFAPVIMFGYIGNYICPVWLYWAAYGLYLMWKVTVYIGTIAGVFERREARKQQAGERNE